MAWSKLQQRPSCVPSINAKQYAVFCMPDNNVMFVSQATSIGQYEHVKRQAKLTYKLILKGLRVPIIAVEKAIIITYSEYLSVASVIQHATPQYVICGLPGSTMFCHSTSLTARGLKRKLSNIKCVFRYSVRLSENFLILRRIQKVIVDPQRSSSKIPVIRLIF